MEVPSQVVWLPTYRLPKDTPDTEKFHPSEVKKCAEEVLAENLSRTTAWDEDECMEICIALSDEIKDRVKAKCNIPRYKLVVQVTVGERKDQGVRVASRCMWDPDTDNYATATFKNVRSAWPTYTLIEP